MSAYMVPTAHIDYLVFAARCWKLLDDKSPDEVGSDLVLMNYASVDYLYRDHHETPRPDAYHERLPTRRLDPVVVLKAIDCYEYQSCEHPNWEESPQRAFCEELRRAAIDHLPGYQQAPWTIDN